MTVRRLFLGFDFGGTGVKYGVTDDDGNIVVERRYMPSEVQKGPDDFLARLRASLDLGDLPLKDIKGAGLASCGPMSLKERRLLQTANLHGSWNFFPFPDKLSEALGGMDVTWQNDANAAALGELFRGVGIGSEAIAVLTLGTGIGGGYATRDRGIHEGQHDHGMEIGHLPYMPNLPFQETSPVLCGCGRTGCIEAYGSATAITRRANFLAGRFEGKTKLDKAWWEQTPESDRVREILTLALQGDPLCFLVGEEGACAIAHACQAVAVMFDPDLIAFTGGMAENLWLIAAIQRHFDRIVSPTLAGKFVLQSGIITQDAGWIGAAMDAKMKLTA